MVNNGQASSGLHGVAILHRKLEASPCDTAFRFGAVPLLTHLEYMKQSMLILLTVMALCAGSSSGAFASAWTDIKVEVKADRPVATAQSLQEQADGFQRLAIKHYNNGNSGYTRVWVKTSP